MILEPLSLSSPISKKATLLRKCLGVDLVFSFYFFLEDQVLSGAHPVGTNWSCKLVFSGANKVAKKVKSAGSKSSDGAEKPPKPNGLDVRTLLGLMGFSEDGYGLMPGWRRRNRVCTCFLWMRFCRLKVGGTPNQQQRYCWIKKMNRKRKWKKLLLPRFAPSSPGGAILFYTSTQLIDLASPSIQ